MSLFTIMIPLLISLFVFTVQSSSLTVSAPGTPGCPAKLLGVVQDARDFIVNTLNAAKSMTELREKVLAGKKTLERKKEVVKYQPCSKPEITPDFKKINALFTEIDTVTTRSAKDICASSLPQFESSLMSASKENVKNQLELVKNSLTADEYTKIKENITSEAKFVGFFSVCYGTADVFGQIPAERSAAENLLRRAKYVAIRTYIYMVKKRVSSLENFFLGKWKSNLQSETEKVEEGFQLRIKKINEAVNKLKAEEEERIRKEKERIEKEKKAKEAKLESDRKAKQAAAEAARLKQEREKQEAINRQKQQEAQTFEKQAINGDMAIVDNAQGDESSSSSISPVSSLSIALLVIGSIVLVLLIAVQVQLCYVYRQTKGKAKVETH